MAVRTIANQQSLEQRRALKPENGDIVRYLGKEYVATAVGTRYVRCYEVGTNPKYTEALPVQYLVKTGKNIKDAPPPTV
jgi:hypothetical protein